MDPRSSKNLDYWLALSWRGLGDDWRMAPAPAWASVNGAVQAMGRNPDPTPTIQTNMILGIAFAEAAAAIYALAVAR